MLKRVLLGSAMLALAVHCATAQQRDVKIGFVTTLSGGPAAVGNDMRDAFELALDHLGRKMSGLPVQVIYEDDGLKPEAREAEDRQVNRIRERQFPDRIHDVAHPFGVAEVGG